MGGRDRRRGGLLRAGWWRGLIGVMWLGGVRRCRWVFGLWTRRRGFRDDRHRKIAFGCCRAIWARRGWSWRCRRVCWWGVARLWLRGAKQASLKLWLAALLGSDSLRACGSVGARLWRRSCFVPECCIRQIVIIISACGTSSGRSNRVVLHAFLRVPIPQGAMWLRLALRWWIICCRK